MSKKYGPTSMHQPYLDILHIGICAFIHQCPSCITSSRNSSVMKRSTLLQKERNIKDERCLRIHLSLAEHQPPREPSLCYLARKEPLHAKQCDPIRRKLSQ